MRGIRLATAGSGFERPYGLFIEDHRTDPWIYPAVNQPFVIRKITFNPASFRDPYQGQENPFPYVYTPTAARFSLPMSLLTVAAQKVPNPYVHHLSFTVEKALPGTRWSKLDTQASWDTISCA